MELVQAFRKSHVGSKVFNVRLIEVVSVAVHQLGAMAFKADCRLHQGDVDSIAKYVDPRWPDFPPRPSLFNHGAYLAADIYPDKAADVVGYWTENRNLGGVIVFERKTEASSDPANPPNPYMFADRLDVTGRICQLRDDQLSALLEFFTLETSTLPALAQSCPLPILLDDDNRVRVNPHHALFRHRIYQDVWERRPYTLDQLMVLERRPRSTLDYPEERLLMDLINTFPLSNGLMREDAPKAEASAAEPPKLELPALQGKDESSGSVQTQPVPVPLEVPLSPGAQRKFWHRYFQQAGLPSVWDVSESEPECEDGEHGNERCSEGESKGGETSKDDPGEPATRDAGVAPEDPEAPGLSQFHMSGIPSEEDVRDAESDTEYKQGRVMEKDPLSGQDPVY